MKTNMKRLATVITGLLILLVLPGCLDIFFTTEVKPNGEIVKTIVFEGDSTEILTVYFPFMKNESWEREWFPMEEKDKAKLVLTKTFKNARLAANDMNPADTVPYVRFQPELRKKFRWFFSYYEYNDLLLATNPFTKVDWKDYIPEEMIDLILLDEEEREADPRYKEEEYKSLEKEFENYLLTSAFEEFYQLLLQTIEKNPQPSLNAEILKNKKAEIYQAAVDEPNNDDLQAILKSIVPVLDSTALYEAYQQDQDPLDYFDKKLSLFNSSFDDNLVFTIRMPGLLINTNSSKIEGNSLTWDMDFFQAFFKDYPMKAESRVVNTWAFVVTGFLFLFLLAGLIWSSVKRRKG